MVVCESGSLQFKSGPGPTSMSSLDLEVEESKYFHGCRNIMQNIQNTNYSIRDLKQFRLYSYITSLILPQWKWEKYNIYHWLRYSLFLGRSWTCSPGTTPGGTCARSWARWCTSRCSSGRRRRSSCSPTSTAPSPRATSGATSHPSSGSPPTTPGSWSSSTRSGPTDTSSYTSQQGHYHYPPNETF